MEEKTQIELADAVNDRYWSKYDWARPYAAEELLVAVDPKKDYRKYLPLDPSHPRAWIPPHVRWAKRSEVNFRCPITGWGEQEYFRDVQGRGPIRLVGFLTIDHIVPGALGGMTTDENIRAVSELVNTKKGSKTISDEELRTQILTAYEKVDIPTDLYKMLRKYNITQFKL